MHHGRYSCFSPRLTYNSSGQRPSDYNNVNLREKLMFMSPLMHKYLLQTWLQNNNIHFSETDKKDTLLKLCRQNYKSPVYVVDRVIHEAGHKPLRLPPYHCIFNPIEMVWSQTKRTYDSEVLKNKNPILAWRTALEGVSAEQWIHYMLKSW
jgi:hypothetical protein